MLTEFLKKMKIKTIPEPPYTYDTLLNLSESEYPEYLKKIFYYMTGEKLHLNNPKTFNEKIQWLKLYDSTPIKKLLTDKVLARSWVENKIGSNYLKPSLQICPNFDSINFETLPDKFIIKCNHGCKWHFKIKNKQKLLSDEQLLTYLKTKFDDWMRLTFFPWGGLEMQYKDIKPQIIIEPLLIDENEEYANEYEIYCFNGIPKIFQKIQYKTPPEYSIYKEDYTISDINFNPLYINKNEKADEILKKAVELSKILAADFKLVRIDWMLHNEQLYFNEMTFTPFSGFFIFEKKAQNIKLGNMLELNKRTAYERNNSQHK